MNAALGTFTALLVYLIGLEVWGRRVGMVAGSFAAAFPPLVFMAGALLAENLFVPLTLGAVYAGLRAARAASWGPRLAWAAGIGVLIGASALTRTNGLLLIVPLLLAVTRLPRRGEVRRALAAPACVLAAAVLTLLPWTVRNAAAFGQFVPVSTQAGYTLAGTYNEIARDEGHGLALLPDQLPEYAALFRQPGINEAQIDDDLVTDAKSFVVDHPGYPFLVLSRNALRWFDLSGDPAYTNLWYQEADLAGKRKSLAFLSAWCALVLAVLAIALPSARKLILVAPGWLWLVPALLAPSSLLVVGNPRYRWVVDPFLLLLGALAVETLRRRGAGRPVDSTGWRFRPAPGSRQS